MTQFHNESPQITENIKKLAEIIQDYEGFPKWVYLGDKATRFNSLGNHIRTWLSQFEPNDMDFVLQHTLNVMSKNYYAKDKYIERINALASNKENQETFRNGCLLEIQENGNSQKNINFLLKTCLSNHGINIPIYRNDLNLNQYNNLIYFDDFSFSGNRIKQDIQKLLDDNKQTALEGRCILISIFLVHSYSQHNLPIQLDSLVNESNNQPLFHFSNTQEHPFCWKSINNSFQYYTNLSETYFPEDNIIEIPEGFQCNELYNPSYFRNGNHYNCLLGNDVDRRRIEKIFTEKGFDILSYSTSPKSVIKPLGYSGFNGFGFGGNVFSYRNCPNNTPLVFWWGNYEENDDTPLDCWYPLMKRTTYDE